MTIMAQEPSGPPEPNDLDVHCRVCGRTLTAEVSVARELGPVCARHLLDEAVPA